MTNKTLYNWNISLNKWEKQPTKTKQTTLTGFVYEEREYRFAKKYGYYSLEER